MTNARSSMDRIDESMREPVGHLIDVVTEATGGGAKSLALFGAIAAGSFDRSRHTARSVLVVERVDLTALQRLAQHGLKLGKSRIAAPLIMTPAYIKSSLDTFPLEMIEIHQNHITVLGEEYFDKLTFDEAHIRLQCERELKTILIGLRQGLLAATGSEKLLGALAQDVGEGLMRTLRGLLWLKGQRDAKPAATVITEVEKIAERELPGIRTALDGNAAHGWPEFERLYRDVEAIGEVADAW